MISWAWWESRQGIDTLAQPGVHGSSAVSSILWRTPRGAGDPSVLCLALHCTRMIPVLSFLSPPLKKIFSSLNDLIRIFWVRRNKAKSFIIWKTDFDSLFFTPAISESAETQIKQLQNKTKTTNTLKVELRVPSLTFSVSYMYKMCGFIFSLFSLPPYLDHTLYRFLSLEFSLTLIQNSEKYLFNHPFIGHFEFFSS